MIGNSGHLLLTIINDILDYSKIEAGSLRLTLAPVQLVDCTESAMLLCYDMARTKGLQLSWRIDPTLPLCVMTDASRLQQILLNLLSNAIKFTRTGGVHVKCIGRRLGQNEDGRDIAFLQQQTTLSAEVAASASGVVQKNGSALMRTRQLQSNVNPSAVSRKDSSSATPPTPTRTGGRTPSADRSSAATAPERWLLAFSIRDSGIGISAEQMASLFQTFSQVQHSTGEYGGTVRSTAGVHRVLLCSVGCCCPGGLCSFLLLCLLASLSLLLRDSGSSSRCASVKRCKERSS